MLTILYSVLTIKFLAIRFRTNGGVSPESFSSLSIPNETDQTLGPYA
jgi:hypothetical protein